MVSGADNSLEVAKVKRILWVVLVVILALISGAVGSVAAAPLTEENKMVVIGAAFTTLTNLFADATSAVISLFGEAISAVISILAAALGG